MFELLASNNKLHYCTKKEITMESEANASIDDDILETMERAEDSVDEHVGNYCEIMARSTANSVLVDYCQYYLYDVLLIQASSIAGQR